MKANRPAPGMPASLKPIPASKELDDCDADDALGYRAYGRTRQFQKMFALLGHDAIEKAPARRHELRAVGKEKASQRHRQEELERSNAGVARKGEHGASQRLQMGSHLAQGRSNVVGCLSPRARRSCGPMSGQFLTPLAAEMEPPGYQRSDLRRAPSRPSTALKPSQVAGPMTIPRLMTVRIAAASLGRPPRSLARD